ncbi:MAG: beta-lactamase family protein [Pseudomonadales bacterium]|nr:beta-lactamase family protein [Pseudomonadales bacterium]
MAFTQSRRAQAQDLGLNPAAVEALLTRVGKEVADGLLPAAQVAIARHGKVGVFETFGECTEDSLFCLFSATKAVTSAAAWLLFQEGRLQEDERVADIVPAFASNGKDVVTVGQLFTHTAGFPGAPFRLEDWLDLERRQARFRQWRLSWPPGSRFEYHPSSSMWVIAQIIENRAGIGYTQFVRERVMQPLGLHDLVVGLDGEAANARCVDCVHVGEALTPEEYRAMGLPVPPVTEVTEAAILNFNKPANRAIGVPGGGGFATAADLALFYQALLHGGLDGTMLWSEATRADARRIRTGQLRDPYHGKLANRGLGIIIAGDDDRGFRGFGKTCSPQTFGHNGAGGQLAWVDPVSGISLAYLTNGHDRNEIRQGRRGVAIGSLAAVLTS